MSESGVLRAALRSLVRDESDPLASFRWKNAVLKRAAVELCRGHELYIHGSNSSGKTLHLAALFAAVSRGWRELDGLRLPRFPSPSAGLIVVAGQKQGTDSTLEAFRMVLGDHPAHEVAGPMATTSELWIKPDRSRSDDWRTWSKVSIYTHGTTPPKGLRRDFVWADEPVPLSLWDECLARPRAEGPFFAIISCTPLYARDHDGEPGWRPIYERFAGCLDHADAQGRIRLQTGLRDNKALSAEFIRRFEARYAGTLLEGARLRGEHIDVSGECPFEAALLQRMRERCRPADRVIHLTVQRDVETDQGLASVPVNVALEQWGEHPVDGEDYVIVADPAMGLAKGDPDGALVFAVGARALVGRVSARVGSWALGLTCARISQLYRDARLEFLSGGHSAKGCYDALRTLRFSRYIVVPGDTPGKVAGRLGFVETQDSRERIVANVQGVLASGSVAVYSHDVVDALAGCVVNAKGKIEAASGAHDEDMLLLGRGTMLLGIIPRPARFREERSSVDDFRDQLRRDGWRGLERPGPTPPGFRPHAGPPRPWIELDLSRDGGLA